jgi:hypothetical protein
MFFGVKKKFDGAKEKVEYLDPLTLADIKNSTSDE